MKKRNIFVLACIITMSFGLYACAGNNSDKEVSSVTVETEPAKTEADDVEDSTTLESVQEETTENEEVTGPQNVAEWSLLLDRTVPKLTIWNDISKEGTILENGQKVVLKDGDLLVVCMNEEESYIEINSPIKSNEFRSYGTANYKIFEFYKEFSEEFSFEFLMTIDGVDYSFNVTLVSEGVSLSEDDISGKDWAFTLEFDEPKLIVWNDETGTKEVVDEGGKYQMQTGDVLGVYSGDKLIPAGGDTYDGFITGTNVGGMFSVIDYVLPDESRTINLEIGFYNVETSEMEENTFNCIIVTP